MSLLGKFLGKKEKSLIKTKLNGTGTDKRQELIKTLSNTALLNANVILTRGTIGIGIYLGKTIIGTVSSKVVDDLINKYGSTSDGLAFNVNVKSFEVLKNSDKFDIIVILEISA